jgi:hypothetical protein
METRLIINTIDLSLVILKEYYKFINIFHEEISIKALLKYRK